MITIDGNKISIQLGDFTYTGRSTEHPAFAKAIQQQQQELENHKKALSECYRFINDIKQDLNCSIACQGYEDTIKKIKQIAKLGGGE